MTTTNTSPTPDPTLGASPPRRTPLPQFPESVLRPRRARWRHRIRAIAILAVIIGVVAAAALVARNVSADTDARVRTSTATTQAISEEYRVVAAIEPVARAQVAFPVAGDVTAVDVVVGDTVGVGDALATIDDDSLEQALRQAEATLASAQLTLNIALSGEDPSSSGAGGLGGNTPTIGTSSTGDVVFEFASTSPDGVSYVLVETSDDVAAAREAVVAAQSAVNSAANTVAAKRDAAVSICAAVDITIDPTDPTASLDAISSSLGACQSALDDLMTAQDALTAAQQQLTAAADVLDSLLATWASELESTPTTTVPTEPSTPTTTTPTPTPTTVPTEPSTPTTPDGSVPDGSVPDESVPDGFGPDGSVPDIDNGGGRPSDGGSGGAPSGGGFTGGGSAGGGAATGGGTATVEAREPTAAELIAYQDAVDAAEQSVESARQAIAQTTIVSPIAGTVVSIGISPGDSVSAVSDTQTIVVQGDGGFEATMSVSVDDIDKIIVGQHAELAPDGGGAKVTGEVVAISQVPDSSGTTANYRVTVGLSDDAGQLRDGNIGDVAIVVDTSDGTTAVPTSAIATTATGHTIDVVDADGVVTTTQVEIGAVGAEWTEIRRGVELGQTVVIADLDEPLPGSATDISNQLGGGGGAGGLPGGGRFPGGGGLPGGFGG